MSDSEKKDISGDFFIIVTKNGKYALDGISGGGLYNSLYYPAKPERYLNRFK